MCLTPQKLYSGNVIPCGRCAECIIAYRNAWICRILAESQYYDHLFFITLTYSDENLVYVDDEFAVLNFSDLQKYFKKLRKSNIEFKYFAVGEYGEKSKRPHYHVILMTNSKIENLIIFDAKWELGLAHVMNAGNAQIRYALKDMLKFKGREDRFKAKFRCSKGMGLSYALNNIKWFKDDLINRNNVYVFGESFVMPRYFKEKIYTIGERDYKNYHHGISRAKRDTTYIVDKQTEKKARTKARTSVYENSQKLREVLRITHVNKKL